MADRLLTLLLLIAEALITLQDMSIRSPFRPRHASPNTADHTGVPEEFSGLLSIIEQIRTLVAGSPALAECLNALPSAFGDGESLRLLFLNLFVPQSKPQVRPAGDKTDLTPRELEVLYLAANGDSRQAIAEILSINPRTVDTHLQNVNRKLGTRGPQHALGQAVARGYVDLNKIGYRLERMRFYMMEGETFRNFCTTVGALEPPFTPEDVNPLAAFSLLLLAVSAAAVRQKHGGNQAPSAPNGAIYEVDRFGTIVHAFGAEHMNVPRSMVVAPE